MRPARTYPLWKGNYELEINLRRRVLVGVRPSDHRCASRISSGVGMETHA